MENKSNFKKTIEILKDNINRILNEKDQSARWLSLKIEKNAWYITSMLEGKLVPSLQVKGIFQIENNVPQYAGLIYKETRDL